MREAGGAGVAARVGGTMVDAPVRASARGVLEEALGGLVRIVLRPRC